MSPVITASVPLLEPPAWAVAQRQLLDLLDQAWRRFDRDFTGPDGRLNYAGRLTSRDGVDDFYEPFFNWPQLYLLGGADDLLTAAERHWVGVTRQLTELGMLHNEYERGYDWFHQSESMLLLYFLCMAAPDRWTDRAQRFASLYVDPAHGNYDPGHRIIRNPHNGSDQLREGLFDGDSYPWLPEEARRYGFPLDWIPQRDSRLGSQMRHRMGRGDSAVNLAAVSLVLNALLLSGETRFQDWIAEYVGAWRERAIANRGVLPDNVAPDGTVGGLLEGRWYGGHYGWSWPHGWYGIGQAATGAALAAVAATGDESFLDLVRPTVDEITSYGKVMAFTESDSSLRSRWTAQLGEDVRTPTLHVPFRYADRGWFDYNPMLMSVPTALWHHSAAPADQARIDRLRHASGYEWGTVRAFRGKEEAGHEEPWYAFLAGDNPDYPERILAAAQAQVRHRLARMAAYREHDVSEADIHLWQQSNPVVTEALVQLTWGGPQVIYNGGLQQARLRYYDAHSRRPGLPPAVAALVSAIEPEATVVDLVNLDPLAGHAVIVQAGAFAEHSIRDVTHTRCADASWLGDLYDYGHREPAVTTASTHADGPWLRVELPRSTSVRLTLWLDLRAHRPSYRMPADITR